MKAKCKGKDKVYYRCDDSLTKVKEKDNVYYRCVDSLKNTDDMYYLLSCK